MGEHLPLNCWSSIHIWEMGHFWFDWGTIILHPRKNCPCLSCKPVHSVIRFSKGFMEWICQYHPWFSFSHSHEAVIYHCLISTSSDDPVSRKYFLNEETQFDSVDDLISFYQDKPMVSAGFKQRLTHPVPRPDITAHLGQEWVSIHEIIDLSSWMRSFWWTEILPDGTMRSSAVQMLSMCWNVWLGMGHSSWGRDKQIPNMTQTPAHNTRSLSGIFSAWAFDVITS